MKRAQMNALCEKLVKFVEKNPNCTRAMAEKVAHVEVPTDHAWETIKHLFDYKPASGRTPVTYKRNKLAYSRTKAAISKQPQRPSLEIQALARQMSALISAHNGIMGVEIRERLHLTTSQFKRASLLLAFDRKRTFGRGVEYWPLGTAPEKVKAEKVQKVITPIEIKAPVYTGVMLTQWRGGNPFFASQSI